MKQILFIVILIWGSFSVQLIEGFFNEFEKGDLVEVRARKVTSHKGLPYEFYALPFCRPSNVIETRTTLGEYFFGERIHNTVFDIKLLKEVKCRELKPTEIVSCPTITDEMLDDLIDKIRKSYLVQLEIDNLPSADLTIQGACGQYLPYFQTGDDPQYRSANGFLLGCKIAGKDEYIINNHFSFNIKYHENSEGKYSIVAFEVYPSSVMHSSSSCNEFKDIPDDVQEKYVYLHKGESLGEKIKWSYSVHWEKSKIKWSLRWDNYVHSDEEDRNTHWFAIINSILVVIFLTGCVAFIMLSILKKDILMINRQDEDEPDETGWKLLHGDVFRCPNALMLLSVCIGSGVQLLGTLFCLLLGALLGILSPANRGGLMTGLIVLTAFLGTLSGYFSLKVYRTHDGKRWKTTTILTGFFFPGILFIVIAFGNFLIKVATNSSIVIPFLSMFYLFLLWIGIFVPLVFLGGYLGYRKEPAPFPCKVRKIPGIIPRQPWYVSSYFSILFGGILPFGAIFIELYFLFSSLWFNKFYYLFGFLFVVFLILIITCSEITIVLTYFQLCNEDYRWWWRSFLSSGSSALYLFLYAVLYYFTTLKITTFLLAAVYFTYTIIMCFGFFLVTGTIGFVASYYFVLKIYGSIKID